MHSTLHNCHKKANLCIWSRGGKVFGALQVLQGRGWSVPHPPRHVGQWECRTDTASRVPISLLAALASTLKAIPHVLTGSGLARLCGL